jgi:PAS domain S-box-containing protein
LLLRKKSDGGKKDTRTMKKAPGSKKQEKKPALPGSPEERAKQQRVDIQVEHLHNQIELILGATKTGLDIIDKDFKLRYVDPAWQKVYGDFSGRKCYEYFMGRTSPCEGCGIPKALATKAPVRSEEILLREGKRPIEIISIPFKDEHGEWLVAEVNIDIAERKRTEEAYKETETRFNQLAEHTRTVAWDVDARGLYTYVSPVAEAVWGYRPDELVGQVHNYDLHPESGRYAFRTATLAVFDQKKPFRDLENAILTKDGSEIWVSTSGIPLLNAGGTLQGYRGNDTDITDRKRAREQAAHLASFPELTPVLILEVDLFGSILYANPAIRKATEMMGISDVRIFIPQDIRERLNGTMAADSLQENREIEIQGRLFQENVYCTPEFQSLRVYATDISERKKYEKTLSEIAQRTSFALESGGLGAWELDLQNHTAWRSLRHDQIFGYDDLLPEWTYEMFLDHVLPEDRSEVERTFGQALIKNKDWDFECRIRRKDGNIRWIWAKGRPEFNDIHEPYKMFGIVQDITDNKRINEALQESEEKFRAIAEQSTEIIYTTDPQGMITYISPIVRSLFLYPPEEMTGRCISEFLSEKENERLIPLFTDVVQHGKSVKNLEMQMIKKDGTIFFGEISSSSFRTGNFIGTTGLIRDISERKQGEEALRVSEERYRTLAEASPDQIFIIGRDDTMRYANAAALKMFHLPYDQVIGTPRKELFPPEIARLQEASIQKVFESGEIVRKEEAIQFAKLKTWIDTNLVPLKDDAGTVTSVLGIARDITTQKLAEEAIKESEEKFRAIFYSASDAIQIHEIGPDFIPGKFIDVNENACRMLMMTREEILNHSPLDFATEYHNPPLPEILHLFTTKGGAVFETGHRRSDGVIVPVEINAHVINLQGKTAMIGIIRDITERKAAEEAQRKGEVRFAELFNTVSSGVAIYEVTNDGLSGKDYIIKDFNTTALALEGKKKEEVIGKSLFDLRPTIDDYGLIPIFREVWKTGSPAYFPATIYIDEKYANYYENRVFRLPGGDIVAIYDDVTERKREEEDLKFSNLLLATQQDVSIDGILIVDESGKILSFNRRFIEIWGIPQDVVASRSDERALQSVMDKLTDPVEFLARVTYLYTNRDEKSRDEIALKDGRVFDRYSAPMTGGDGTYYGRVWNFRDITERKEAEEKISNLKEFQESVIANANVWITVLDPKGTILVWNDAAEAITGYKRGDVLGRRTIWKDLYPDKTYRNKVTSEIFRIIGQDAYLDNFETEIRCADKRQKTIVWNTRGIRDSTGTIQSYIAISRDISEQRRAEEALRESKALVDAVVENVPLMIFLKEATDLRFVLFNKAGEELLGYDRQALLGKNNLDLFPPDQAAQFMSKDREVLDGDAGMLDIPEEPISTAKKGLRLLHTRKVCIRGTDGTTKFLLGISEDITDQKVAENAIRESESRYRALINSSSEGILVSDTETHRIRHANPSICRMLGYSEEEFTTLGMEDMIPKESIDYVMGEFMAQERKKKTLSQNIPLLRKDTTILYTDVSSARITIDEKMSVVGFFTDITERKKAEDFLKHFNEDLEHQVKSRTNELNASLEEKVVLLREVHHRVKNNLQIILSLIKLQSKNIKDPLFLDTMGEFQNRIIAIAHIHEKMTLSDNISKIDLSEIIAYLGKSLFIAYNVDPRLIRLNVQIKDLKISIDAAIPVSLITNELITNSIKHAFLKGAPGEITIAGHRTADSLVLSFKDTGIGIPKEMDWRRNDQTLGHRLVVNLVQQLDGTIELDRTVAGTAFTIVVKDKES